MICSGVVGEDLKDSDNDFQSLRPILRAHLKEGMQIEVKGLGGYHQARSDCPDLLARIEDSASINFRVGNLLQVVTRNAGPQARIHLVRHRCTEMHRLTRLNAASPEHRGSTAIPGIPNIM